MHRWEHGGRFEYADTREQAAALFGATDPNEVRFAGYCDRRPTPLEALLAKAKWVAATSRPVPSTLSEWMRA